ncbi:MAG: hypothetical protein RSA27_09090, partial [Oscillospiraceae bacterium]
SERAKLAEEATQSFPFKTFLFFAKALNKTIKCFKGECENDSNAYWHTRCELGEKGCMLHICKKK